MRNPASPSPLFETCFSNSLEKLEHSNPISNLKQQAFRRFQELGVPNRHHEQWKYAGFHAQLIEALKPPISFNASSAEQALRSTPFSKVQHFIGCYNGHPHIFQGLTGLQAKPLSTVWGETPSTLQGFDEAKTSSSYSAMECLNQSFLKDSVYLHIPDGVSYSEPIYLMHLVESPTSSPVMVHPRNHIVVGKKAKVQIIELYLNTGSTDSHPERSLQNAVTHLNLSEGAEVQHVIVQSTNSQSLQLAHVHVEQQSNSHYESHVFGFGGLLNRVELTIGLQATAASCKVHVLQAPQKKEIHDVHLQLNHQAGGCTSNVQIRSLVQDEARAALTGKIVVHPKASDSVADLQSKTLILSPLAEADVCPQLEIYNDAVQCSHGAATGFLDPAVLFYLQSRGIPESEAKQILIQSFTNHILNPLFESDVKKYIEDRLLENECD